MPFILQDEYAIHSRTKTSEGSKIYLKCRLYKSCKARLCLLYHIKNDKVTLFTNGTHEHLDIQPSRGIHPSTKSLINEMFKDGTRKPRIILATLQDLNCPYIPTRVQLANYLMMLRNREFKGEGDIKNVELKC